jgi:cytochrome b
MATDETTENRPAPVTVWDLPTRCFHWLLLALVVSSFVTGKIGGNLMTYHVWSGETILTLLLFRVIWGFNGSAPSRFCTFLAGPGTVSRYALTLLRRDTPHYIGHNPLGGWSVMAMLLALFIQAGTGLFANDDIATTGPLYKWVSKAASDRLTSIHRLNQDIIIVLVAVHLITPMITGMKQWKGDPAEDTSQQPLWLAAVAAAVAAGAVYFLVR